MPILTGQQLRDVVYEILLAAGATEENAETVAVHLADANLTGHDSHGLLPHSRLRPANRGRTRRPQGSTNYCL